MRELDRTSRESVSRLALIMLAAAVLAACQASGGTTSSAPAPLAESASPSVASPTIAALTPPPTATPLPLAISRPTDLPTDGSCEPSYTCLGLISPGKHHTEVFSPGFEFVMPTAGWENLADEGGVFELLSLDQPGDAISFFRDPRPSQPDGTPVSGVPTEVDALVAWLATNPTFALGPRTQVSIGGLDGVWMDFAIAPGAESHPSDCPVQVCALMFHGRDPSANPTWEWDWGSAGPERQRLYLLAAKDGVVAIFVDSLDGTTFEDLTRSAGAIIATVTFDGT